MSPVTPNLRAVTEDDDFGTLLAVDRVLGVVITDEPLFVAMDDDGEVNAVVATKRVSRFANGAVLPEFTLACPGYCGHYDHAGSGMFKVGLN